MTYEEYRELQKAAYDRVNWSNRESIKKYNEYCRELRREMAYELDGIKVNR